MRYEAVVRRDCVVARLAFVAMVAALFASAHGRAFAESTGYGKVGDPINLVVGYQPYGTENLDAVVVREKDLWKKYLPAGSTVKMEIALQGSIIVNNMLAGKQQIGFMRDMPSIISTTK